jgi:hypothetical protein
VLAWSGGRRQWWFCCWLCWWRCRRHTLVMWEVVLHPEVEAWFLGLCRTDPTTSDLVAEAVDLLAERGPTLGRPLVDRLKESTFHNMNELWPGSTGTTEVRLIFAFDPIRRAVFLVAGDKSGRWQAWYRTAIGLADARFSEHLASLKEQEGQSWPRCRTGGIQGQGQVGRPDLEQCGAGKPAG